MDVHKELALDVLGGETAEAVWGDIMGQWESSSRGQGRERGCAWEHCDLLDLVENDAGGLEDLEDTDNRGKNGDGEDHPVVGDGEQEDIVVLDALRLVRGDLLLA